MQTFIKIQRENFPTEFFTFVFHSLLRPELSILMQNKSQIWLWQWDIGISTSCILANADETLLQKASGYEVVLEPGQVLYVPKHWWHYVECESTAISVNTWIELVSQNKIQSDIQYRAAHRFGSWLIMYGIFWSCIPFVLETIIPVLCGIVSTSFLCLLCSL